MGGYMKIIAFKVDDRHSQITKNTYSTGMTINQMVAYALYQTFEGKNSDGFQRPEDIKRIDDIYAYYTEQKNQGLPLCVGSISMATDLHLTLHENGRLEITHKLNCLDGQHRIKGLAKVAEKDRSFGERRVSVLVYDGLTIDEQRNIFMTINSEQKGVDSNLINTLKIKSENKTANFLSHNIVKELKATALSSENGKSTSPLRIAYALSDKCQSPVSGMVNVGQALNYAKFPLALTCLKRTINDNLLTNNLALPFNKSIDEQTIISKFIDYLWAVADAFDISSSEVRGSILTYSNSFQLLTVMANDVFRLNQAFTGKDTQKNLAETFRMLINSTDWWSRGGDSRDFARFSGRSNFKQTIMMSVEELIANP